MNLKNVALLAFVGMLLLTIRVGLEFFNLLLGVMHNIVPPVALLKSVVSLFASFSVTVFFFVFQRERA